MKKKILTGLLIGIAVIVIGGLILFFIATSPGGNIENYKDYYTDDTSQPVSNQVKVTFFGVSTLLFDDGETQILIDGFFSRPSLRQILFSEISSDTKLIDEIIAKYQMNRVKGIFVTHSHFDHAFDVAYTTQKTKAVLYGSLSTLNIGYGGGLKKEQTSEFKPNEPIQIGQFTVTVVPSKHSPDNALKDDGVAIEKPLAQPAKIKAYSEGGSYDFLITHKEHSIYIKPSPNYIEGALDNLKADVLFIGIATVGKQKEDWQNKFYEQNVSKLKPKLIIPLHWDDFTRPLSEHLEMLPRFANYTPRDFDFMIEKTKADKIDFKILQGTKSIILFK